MATAAYNVVFALPGTIDSTDTVPGTVLPVECFPFEVDFSADFGGSVGSVMTNPTNTSVFNILKNGSTVGTITVATTGVVTYASTGHVPVSFLLNDNLDIQVPGSSDATLAGMRFTLNGTVTI